MIEFKCWLESSLNDLYQSAVQAFPRTRFRQHSTDPIRITKLEWIPYLGVKTLYLKGLAQNPEGTRGFSENQAIILFKQVNYHPAHDQANLVEIVASDQQHYWLEKLRSENNDVLVRCSCADYAWRASHANHLDGSLFGRRRRQYESLGVGPPANPTNAPMLCKHLIKLAISLRDSGVLG